MGHILKATKSLSIINLIFCVFLNDSRYLFDRMYHKLLARVNKDSDVYVQ